MKVSIITVCYNREATIRAAIESVLAQDYEEIEYIVVDGASTDGSLSVIREYESRIATLISEPDRGMYEALNKGLRAATGDVIGLVHSDDTLYDTQVVSRLVRTFDREQADFVYADGLFVSAPPQSRVVRNWKSGSFSRWKLRNAWLPLHPTCYIKRSLLAELGYYDESFKIAADTDFLLRYLSCPRLRVAYLPSYVIRMQMGGLSTDSQKRRLMWEEDLRAFRNNGFSPRISKLKKMVWKLPQFVSALWTRS